ncbi:MAG: NAD-binding protein [Polyangiaceae bacterium]|nr:NAD-binding protein [Polyangiaceae bacterium]
MPRPALPDLGLVRRVARSLGWRGVALAFVFACGLAGFLAGVDVSDRAGLPAAPLAVKIYYAFGLFVLGGMDLGLPVSGPLWAQGLLWFAYFAAPAITASAVADGLAHILRPDVWRRRRLRGHVVVGGCGRLTMLYLKRLRAVDPHRPVVVVERTADHPNAALVRDLYKADVVTGNVASGTVLDSIGIERADRVLFLTDDDFANLDGATRVLGLQPQLAGRIVVHVANLHFARVIAHTRVAKACEVFNIHVIAAQHLVEHRLLEHFRETAHQDVIVFAGFGRFGQTMLDVLQRRAQGKFDTVVLVDMAADARALDFEEQVGFGDWYERHVVEGDLHDRRLWRRLEPVFNRPGHTPVFVIGSGDDGTNLHTALWLARRYPAALTVSRNFRQSAFAEELSQHGGFYAFSVAELLGQSLPEAWFKSRRGRAASAGLGPAPGAAVSLGLTEDLAPATPAEASEEVPGTPAPGAPARREEM